MKKFSLFIFLALWGFSAFCQTNSIVYKEFGVINRHTNGRVLPSKSDLKISKLKDGNFEILVYDPALEEKPLYTLKIRLKGYDEWKKTYVYIGESLRVYQGFGVGFTTEKEKCMITSSKPLDFYLQNNGQSRHNRWEWNRDLSFSVVFSESNTFIQIFPVENKPYYEMLEDERKELEAKEKKKRAEEEKKKNQIYIEKVLEESKKEIENKLSLLRVELAEQCKDSIISRFLTKTANTHWNQIFGWTLKFDQPLCLEEVLVDGEGKFDLYLSENNISTANKDINIYNNTSCGFHANYKKCMFPELYSALESKVKHQKPYGERETYEKKCIYYRIGNDILACGYDLGRINFKVKTIIIGVKLKKDGQFKYYADESLPQGIKEWCTENITQKGVSYISCVIIDDEMKKCGAISIENEIAKKCLKNRYLKSYLIKN